MFARTGSNSTLSLWILALAIAFALLAAFVLFPSGILKVFAAPTRGLVTATLVANFISLAVIVASFMPYRWPAPVGFGFAWQRSAHCGRVDSQRVDWSERDRGAWQAVADGAVR